ncbi:predicted protein [Uncinocarpus reesii 1704]|uniref:J domain-containing protein n=1 Tax=Uncinocarpus reesii (strain UAMH 1704) TaxID=336963 RepID=C4K067_UNCRE|nr:uncharacterized protein UREG_07818 [Uncinocarpus reesii 1704]EEP82953.1 predicted protein [Uncinocarpus reesii 1704]
MGQSQSSRGDNSVRNHGGSNTDFYLILGVDPLAGAEEIKKAYRKKALELHPDRNYGNVESCTARFAEVQAAYDVLSDPQERAWYDSHRDAILCNASGSEGVCVDSRWTQTDDILNLMMRFNPHMEFSDSPSGYFGGLRKIFDQLAREESDACTMDALEPIDYPSFGYKNDGLEIVRQFYGVWGGFSTKKSFSWKDVYRYSEAPDRRVRRLMEKENKRLRDESSREFNDAIRSFVTFVKKRDPRLKVAVQTDIERQSLLRASAAMQAARSRSANEARLGEYSVPKWAQREDLEEDLFSTEPETDRCHFDCVVCHKTFKSEKQFEAHERSKKHAKALKQLRYEMEIEDEHFRIDHSDPQSADNLQSKEAGIPSSAHSGADHNSVMAAVDGFSRQASTNLQCFGVGTMSAAAEQAEDSKSTPREAVQQHPIDSPLERIDHGLVDQISPSSADSSVSDAGLTPAFPEKIGKAKQKRAKKAIQHQAQQASFICATCGCLFPSRNKLFYHLDKENHALSSGKSRPQGKRSGGRTPKA